ncbi:MAG TPA: DUF4012 domain-containing protein [bacterium]|nr:DUF4012 domain-containing protein [bacterium]
MFSRRTWFWLIFSFFCLLIVIDVLRLGSLGITAYHEAIAGRRSFEQGWQEIKSGNWPVASQDIASAQKSFAKARDNSYVIANHFLWSKVGWYRQQSNSAYNLFKSSEIACRTAGSFLKQADEWQGGQLSTWLPAAVSAKAATTSNAQMVAQMKAIQPLILETLSSINEIESSLAQVDFAAGLTELNKPVSELRTSVESGKKLLAEYLPWIQLAPYIANQVGDGRFLLVLENNDELRPTGGFIGNYGLLELKNGRVANLETHDSYHLDMPAQDVFKPAVPYELNRYLGVKQWFFRDANWSPDFPTTARQLKYFYQEQTKVINKTSEAEKIDGVIAITPPLVEDFLDIVGPITVEDQTYTRSNFVDLLQYRVEMSYDQYGVSSWNRKEVINDVIKELKKRLLALPASRWTEVAQVLIKNLERKNVLLYSENSAIEQWLVQQNWAGKIRQTSGDFLWVVDANLGAYKTDAVVDKHVDYHVYHSGNDWLAEVKLTYSHNGGFDWRTTRYKTFARVYAPKGSQLVKQVGFREVATSTEELGQAVFGGIVTVEPKKTGKATLVYKLPQNIVDQINKGQYSLLLQKQPGRQRTSLSVRLAMPRDIKRSYSEQLELQTSGNQVKGQSGWLVDNLLTVSF